MEGHEETQRRERNSFSDGKKNENKTTRVEKKKENFTARPMRS